MSNIQLLYKSIDREILNGNRCIVKTTPTRRFGLVGVVFAVTLEFDDSGIRNAA